MKRIAYLWAFGAAGLVGCTSVASPEAANITLTPIRSASVSVLQPQLVIEEGFLTLRGSVYRRLNAETTAHTHLDVAFLDANGRPLREEIAHFSPRELRRAPRPPAGRGHYLVPIPALPPGTARIEVRAHDGEHLTHG